LQVYFTGMMIEPILSFVTKVPPKPVSEAPKPAPKLPQRESAQKVFEHRDEWANSPGLRPPK